MARAKRGSSHDGGRKRAPAGDSSPKASAAEEIRLPEDDPKRHPFLPETLDKTVIAIPLIEAIRRVREQGKEGEPLDVIIDLNLEYRGGRKGARERVTVLIEEAVRRGGGDPAKEGINRTITDPTAEHQYVFARLTPATIEQLVKLDSLKEPWVPAGSEADEVAPRAIYRIWNDFEIGPLITRSVRTVKADAARSSFAALGDGIVWAVMDSGIDSAHPHFTSYENLEHESELRHRDFTALRPEDEQPLQDPFGHGTHVAGILAGEMAATEQAPLRLMSRLRNEQGEPTHEVTKMTSGAVTGIAPRCKLLSLRVLDSAGKGRVSNLIAAISYVQEMNGYGRRIRIHGVNMSVGYDFEPEWFACGQSPLCVEVDRLVRSGVVVVVAAGNTGYGPQKSQFRGVITAGMDLTINDPGNAELAITVGSTHRDMPHVYGVSYFSSKGPTGDGRLKPDLVAPGEKIVSCAAGSKRAKVPGETSRDFQYVEDSGTSMAAPHVSGAIAAFLSIRREFIQRPEEVKRIFLASATSLGRERYFEGYGLVDLMRAIQSV